MKKNNVTAARMRAAPPSPAPRPAPRAALLEVDLGVLDGVELAGVVVPVGVVLGCAAGVEDDEDDVDDEVVEEGEAVDEEEEGIEEDDALLVTLKYCDAIRGPWL